MYMAPEILYGDQYQGHAVDLFALAVILFSMRSRHQPFDKMAGKKDPFYKLIVQNRADLFWKAWEQYHPDDENYYSPEFKDLITTMIDYYPQKRPMMADIIGHPWMHGETATQQEIITEFAERHEMIKAPNAEDIEVGLNTAEKIRRGEGVKVQNWTFVSGDMTEEERNDPDTVSPVLLPYDKIKQSTTTIFTDFLPEQIFKCMITELEDKNTTFKVKPTAWRINYTKKRTYAASLDEDSMQSFEEMAKIQIDLFDAGEGKICVQFSR